MQTSPRGWHRQPADRGVGRRRPAQSWSACRKVRCAPGSRSGTVVS